jgi:SAM-dependent methyltransferase
MPGRQAGSDGRAGRLKPPGRAHAVIRVGDLRPGDAVLDVGCGEGSVALEVAPLVGRLHGLDKRADRVERAAEIAAERGIRNASFEAAAIQDFPLEPRSWDVTLFMRIWGKQASGRTVSEAELERVLDATRRQAIIQAGKLRSQAETRRILELCHDKGFDTGLFKRQHLIVANRRGAGAQVRERPELVVVSGSSGPALVPAESVPDHPMSSGHGPEGLPDA